MTSFIGKEPLISVITPVYNGAEYLDELIQSVLQQDYPHIEHIIIDDGSNDNNATVAILKKYPHLRWWSRENKGQYATLNEGLAAAQGDVMVIISADDKFVTPTAFSSVIAFWQTRPECGCIYGQTFLMDENGQSQSKPFYPALIAKSNLAWWIRHAPIFVQHCSLFVAKNLVVENSIYFDTSFRYAGDWEWMLRLAQSTLFGYLSQPLSRYREHTQQVSQQAGRKKTFEENKKILHHYKGNYVIYSLLVLQQRLLKAFSIAQQKGIRTLLVTLKNWF